MGVIREWFERVQLSVGDACVTAEMVEKAMRLAYTWKDCFVTTMNELRQSDLVEHTIQIEPGAVPFRLRQPKYTPAERAFAARIFSQMEIAMLISVGISAWGAHSRFPLKKSGEPRATNQVIRVGYD